MMKERLFSAKENSMSEIVRPEWNVPIECVLKFDQGVPVEGKFGDQVLYTLADDSRLYVQPSVARQIEQLGIRRGMPFVLCKRKSGRSIAWEITRKEMPAAGVAAPAPAQPPAKTPVGTGVVGSHVNGSGNGHGELAVPKLDGDGVRGSVNGNGGGHQAPPAALANALREQSLMLLEVFNDLLKYSSEHFGHAVKAEDVRALVTTAYISLKGMVR
jgi:hypothetical protein